jgi:hypothetical protein
VTTGVVAAILLLVSGCQVGDDDEMVPPSRTVTVTPSPDVTAVPLTVPIGSGPVTPADVVWAQGSTLHVGKRSVDLAPVSVDAFVVVPGGVYVLDDGQLWFTDLARLRGTGLAGLSGLGATADAARILVTGPASAGSTSYAYDTGTGRAVSADGVVAVTPEERLHGPDRAGVRVPARFELAGWAGSRTFYGVAAGTSPASGVFSCSLTTLACARLGGIEAADPVVFGTGT